MNKQQEENRPELAYGMHPVLEAINAGKEIEKVLIQKGIQSPVFKELMTLIKEHGIAYQFVPQEKLNRVSRKNHQGIIAFISPVAFNNIENLLPGIYENGRAPFVLVMDRITDVRNFGAILRTAECTGVDAVIIPSKNTAQLNADAIKSSAGAIFKVPICRSDNLKTTIDFLKNSGLKIVAATEKGEKSIFDSEMSGPLGLIMGSEGEGISAEYLKKADIQVMIPLLGEIESLNVSVAAGVMMYEVVRQRIEKTNV